MSAYSVRETETYSWPTLTDWQWLMQKLTMVSLADTTPTGKSTFYEVAVKVGIASGYMNLRGAGRRTSTRAWAFATAYAGANRG